MVPPFKSDIIWSKLGCASGLLRECVTGWLEEAVALNCGITFRGSFAETARSGRYPKTGLETFPGAIAVTAQAILILINRRVHNRDTIGRADAGHAVLRNAYGRSRREGGNLLRGVPVVAIGASGVPIVVQQHIFGCIVRILPRGKRMPCLGKLGKDVRNGGSKIGAAIVAACTVLLIRSVQQSCRSQRIMRSVAGDTSIAGHCTVAPEIRGQRHFVRRQKMCAGIPSRKRIDLVGYGPVRIVTGKTHLRIRAITHQKVLRRHVDGLNVRVVARGALDVPVD